MKNTIGLFMLALMVVNCQGQINKHSDTVSNLKEGRDTLFSFESDAFNQLPVNWGAPVGKWYVVDDNGNKVLYQSAASGGRIFNIATYNCASYKNLELSVKIKAISGKEDQGGGLVWRYIDSGNYYIVRENPLEDNVVLYKVQDGHRKDLALVGKGRTYGVEVPKLGNGWNNLKVIVNGDLFVVYLNDNMLFQVIDSEFQNAGRIGLWSKADAASWFDDLAIKVIH